MQDTIGKRLRAYRKLKNLTQQELADRLHVSIAIVGAIERGTRVPTNDLLRQIHDVLGVTEQELRGESVTFGG
ncbi:helix-turn-helix transcriptional regulator [Tumebacillus sp. ITR2]|uniref:Helix-turn-helix transcriptional regulator n=1 Tax=Tumebacillus amylolyticus TaxID=2801339 RepID=A0ABS1JFW2_9BACL|nr:helix-turn-helix transcriptional regulator [Tumebacillus amylolyticus]MBL0389159.1 helix-turn-helix transcriptional regulator [Tumebacillus amylolyticus]